MRLAVIDLDSPPAWWTRGRKDCMSAEEARHLAATDGTPTLFTLYICWPNPIFLLLYSFTISVFAGSLLGAATGLVTYLQN